VVTEIVIPAGTAIEAGAVLAGVTVVEAEPTAAEPEPEPEPPGASRPTEPLLPPPAREVDLAGFRSPAVRRLAVSLDVDLEDVSGTGRGGRVTREDVLAHAGRPVAH
jgi:pyruvate/2-oxoglutarate dehydrogenase complex dihydrolipoamide acyltransferase (E2) component